MTPILASPHLALANPVKDMMPINVWISKFAGFEFGLVEFRRVTYVYLGSWNFGTTLPGTAVATIAYAVIVVMILAASWAAARVAVRAS